MLDGEADALLSGLDSLNAGIAYVHEDAFNKLYRTVKNSAVADPNPDLSNPDNTTIHDRRAIYQVDAAQQRQIAEFAIDKMFNSAITLISAQPASCHEPATDVFLLGTTFIADAIQVSLTQLDAIANGSAATDFLRLENSWAIVQSAVSGGVSAIKGVMSLMAGATEHVDSKPVQQGRSKSIDFGSHNWSFFRRMSAAISTASSSSDHSRNGSVSSPTVFNAESVVASCPTRMPPSAFISKNKLSHESSLLHTLSPIPATPDAALINPFDTHFEKSKRDQNSSALAHNTRVPSPMGSKTPNESDSIRPPVTSHYSDTITNTNFPSLTDREADQSPLARRNTRRRSAEISGKAPVLEQIFL